MLFNAVVRWAEQECQRQSMADNPDNQRQVLGRALYLIRFPLMTVEEFAVDVAQSGILTDREVVSVRTNSYNLLVNNSNIFLCSLGLTFPLFYSQPKTNGSFSRRSALLYYRKRAGGLSFPKNRKSLGL